MNTKSPDGPMRRCAEVTADERLETLKETAATELSALRRIVAVPEAVDAVAEVSGRIEAT